jgi:hypothetical protein
MNAAWNLATIACTQQILPVLGSGGEWSVGFPEKGVMSAEWCKHFPPQYPYCIRTCNISNMRSSCYFATIHKICPESERVSTAIDNVEMPTNSMCRPNWPQGEQETVESETWAPLPSVLVLVQVCCRLPPFFRIWMMMRYYG